MNPTDLPEENGRIRTLSDPDDISSYIGGEKKTIVLFEMATCPYCRMFEERFVELSRSRCHDFDFMRVILEDPGNPLWKQYEILAVPTVIVFAGGRVISRLNSVLFLGITKKNWAEFCAAI